MAWTESHQELANHPKTRRLCRALGIGKAQAIGHLHLLWWWALDYAQDGSLERFTDEEIAEGCEWDGDPEAFVAALEAVRFLDQKHIHDWDEYGGKYFRVREQDRERKRRQRAQNTAQPSQNDGGHAEVRGTSRGNPTVEEKRREDKTREDKTHDAPAARVRVLYRTDFESWWKRYPTGHGTKKLAGAQWDRMSVEERRAAEDGLEKWLRSDRWKRGFVKSAELWLRDRWWENDPPEAMPRGPSNGHVGADPRSMFDLARQYEEQGL